eukprot:SAG31_NODE_11764_length_1000_cov_1.003330_1_plen_238_part_10
MAARRGVAEIVAALLAAGADFELADGNSETALHLAARASRSSTALELGNKVCLRLSGTGNGHTDAVAVLLRAGADPSVRDKLGGTPVHSAVGGGHAAAAARLLQHALDMAVQGSAATRCAQHWGRAAALTLARNDQALTAAHLAIESDDRQTLRVVLETYRALLAHEDGGVECQQRVREIVAAIDDLLWVGLVQTNPHPLTCYPTLVAFSATLGQPDLLPGARRGTAASVGNAGTASI